MSYIGKSPSIGSYSMLDSLSASATASYSLTLDSVAFVPESANHLLVSLNGSIQKAGSSYTVSGSTLTFSSTLASSDSIDFVLALGNVLDIGTPSDATVTNAKTNFVSTSSSAGLDIKGDGTTAGTLRLLCEQGSHGIKLRSPAHSASHSYTLTFPTTAPSANKIMQTDGSGNLSFVDAPSGGLVAVGQVDSGGNVGEITLDNKFSSTYTNYLVIVDKMTPASDGANILFRFRDATPSTINSSAYGLVSRAYRANDNGLSSRSGDAQNTFQLTDAGVSNGSDRLGFKMAMWVHNPFTSGVYTATHGTFQYQNNSGYSTGGYFQMQLHENSSPRGVRMYASTGNINGRIKIYGVVDS